MLISMLRFEQVILFYIQCSMKSKHYNCHCCTGRCSPIFTNQVNPITPVLQVHVSQGVDDLPPSPVLKDALVSGWLDDAWMRFISHSNLESSCELINSWTIYMVHLLRLTYYSIQIWWILNSHLNSSKFGKQSCLWVKQVSSRAAWIIMVLWISQCSVSHL